MIRFEQVKKRFGSKQVLDGLNLDIQPGAITFIMGRSGTGKSVLLKCLVGLLSVDDGRLFIDDNDVTRLTEEQWLSVRSRCAMVFQSPALIDSLTVEENIRLGFPMRFPGIRPGDASERCVGALQSVGLSSKWRGVYPSQLGFGHAKRVSIARAVALEPRYLLFDEPTTGLDPVATVSINQLILRLKEENGITAVVVSHDFHCALAIADRVCLLDGGRVAVDGAPDDLLHSSYPLARDFAKEAAKRRYGSLEDQR